MNDNDYAFHSIINYQQKVKLFFFKKNLLKPHLKVETNDTPHAVDPLGEKMEVSLQPYLLIPLTYLLILLYINQSKGSESAIVPHEVPMTNASNASSFPTPLSAQNPASVRQWVHW